MQQIITIAPGGIVSGLQVKPGKGVDLTKLGKATVVRASEIVWDEDQQGWKVDVLQAAGRGIVTVERFAEATEEADPRPMLDRLAPSGWRALALTAGPILFADYSEAVNVEIALLDALRLNGQF